MEEPRLSLEAMRTNRERLVRFLKRLPESSWELYGILSECGKETLTRIVEMLAGHDLAHLRQIRRLLDSTL